MVTLEKETTPCILE